MVEQHKTAVHRESGGGISENGLLEPEEEIPEGPVEKREMLEGVRKRRNVYGRDESKM
jgi:hypothetical protein